MLKKIILSGCCAFLIAGCMAPKKTSIEGSTVEVTAPPIEPKSKAESEKTDSAAKEKTAETPVKKTEKTDTATPKRLSEMSD